MEGLEISERMLSVVSAESRLDADFAAHHLYDYLSELKKEKKFLPLEDVLESIGSGHTPYLHNVKEGEVGFITVECVGSLSFEESRLKRITEEQFHSEFSNRTIRTGDVLCTIKRRICMAYPFLDAVTEKLTINQDVALLRPKPNMASGYLAAYLSGKIGQGFADLVKTEQMNPYISLVSLRKLPVAIPNEAFGKSVESVVSKANHSIKMAKQTYAQAEEILLAAVGLEDFTPSADPVNVKNFSESFATSGRLDAEYYQKKYEEIINATMRYKNWAYLKDVTSYISNGNQPPYSETGTIRFFSQKWIGDKSIDYSFLKSADEPMVDASFFDEKKNKPSLVTMGDILYYSVGANLGYCHNYLADEPIAVGSFINIIRADKSKINEIYLGIALNSIIGRMQGDKEKSGIAQPYIYAKSLREFVIPIPAEEEQQQIATLIEQSFALKKQSEALLEAAKRAVEIAIEEDEAAAMQFIQSKPV